MLNEQVSTNNDPGNLKAKSVDDLGNNASKEALQTKNSINKEAITVHPMPSKFVEVVQQTGRLTPTKGGNGRKIALLAISLVLIIIAVITGIIYFTNKDQPAPDANQVVVQNINTNENLNENTNVNQNINTNTNTNTNVNQNINTNTNTNTNVNQNINTNTNTNTNVNQNTNENVNVQTALDTDNDGLSDHEEKFIYSTNPTLDDTDQDGYKDGQEITSLYNPLLPTQGLAESGLVTRFRNGSYRYSFLRPSAWLVSAVGEKTDKIIILPDSETGETFSIDVSINIDNGSLADALTEMSNILGPASKYQNYDIAGQAAYRSSDGQKVLTMKDNFIFVISYEAGSLGGANFTATFEMILNSFEWTEIGVLE